MDVKKYFPGLIFPFSSGLRRSKSLNCKKMRNVRFQTNSFFKKVYGRRRKRTWDDYRLTYKEPCEKSTEKWPRIRFFSSFQGALRAGFYLGFIVWGRNPKWLNATSFLAGSGGMPPPEMF